MVTSKQDICEDEMISVTNNYLWLKCYLNLFEIVANGKRGLLILARAIANFKSFLQKNLINNIYSFFTLTVMVSLLAATSQANLSSLVNSSIPTISDGIVVLKDFERGFCWITLDFTSNNFIPPFLSFVINIFDNIL